MKITIAIPNFNGENLLPKNLPNILNSGADEILVTDDASKDKSWEVLLELKEKNPKLKITKNKKNLGFIKTVNQFFNVAIGDIVVLLNNDVLVEKDFLRSIEKHFRDPKTFAVTLHEKGEGPSVAFWDKGYYQFKRGEEKDILQKSSWASGGSAAFNKKIWKILGGFDEIYAPFYWEDVDLSFRAIKAGFNVYWEPESKVYHEHETTIKKSHNRKYIEWIKERNQLIFIWKNITEKNLIKEHKIALLKRLFKIGYFVPFFWAIIKHFQLDKEIFNVRSDLEAINYAKQPKVSVVTVTYNNEDSIETYINSVLQSLPENGELLIFDNASTDETVKKIAKFGNKVKLIKSSNNLGFSKGNNKAAKEASGDYLIFLNPDTEILQDTFTNLTNYLENNPETGILAPQLLENDHIQPSVRKLPTLIGAIKEYWFNKKNAYEPYVPDGNDAVEVECVYGAAMIIRKEVFEQLGGFDERYFLYYEDVDLCKRIKKLGLKIIYYPKAKIRHLVGESATKIEKLPWGIRALAWFVPLKRFGSRYHQFKSSDIYHGILVSYLIRTLIYLSIKLKIYKPKEVVTF